MSRPNDLLKEYTTRRDAGKALAAGIDDGSNNTFGTAGGPSFPVFHAAPLDRHGSEKGGPYSEGTSVAGVFTRNRFCAAPVIVGHLKKLGLEVRTGAGAVTTYAVGETGSTEGWARFNLMLAFTEVGLLSIGLTYVIANGEFLVDGGKLTWKLPGRLLMTGGAR